MIEILDMKDVKDATPEELEELRRKGFLPKTRSKRISGKPITPYERTRAQVAATGNRWDSDGILHHCIRHSKANWMRSTGYLFFGKLWAPDQERVLCRNCRSSVELEERY